ncbi:hypothetical protein J3U66_01510 [Gilliamella sp. B2969]|uniref:hypothetical protein n=1 Tax=Gilliamella sp. B2969 TaxID=2818021 RepID=UPI00226A187D|nr:hypothetical protein [Gilliamella sp. B2969]MCX8729054.1 hypothetical protein [Gilliamella sp. B2969]
MRKTIFLSLLSTLLFNYSFTAQALSTKTVNIIQGSAPYIEFNGNEINDLTELLSIRVGNDVYVSDEQGNMKKKNDDGTLTDVTSIMFANVDDIFKNVSTLLPADNTLHAFNDLSIIPSSMHKDIDGDDNFTLTGNFKGEWKDKENVSLDNKIVKLPDICKSPYTLTLTTTENPSISTLYGIPSTKIYGNGSAKYTIDINPDTPAKVCFARPGSYLQPPDLAEDISGPPNMWNKEYGFLIQSTDSNSYNLNFPTTGGDKLYFDMIIIGSPNVLTWPDVTVGGITATMSNITPTTVRVTLLGPSASKEQMLIANAATNPTGPVDKPILPAKFELKGMLNGEVVVKYGFEINKWFITKGRRESAVRYELGKPSSWCSTTGYHLPQIMELTNASSWDSSSDYEPYPPPVQTPSPDNFYKRMIGGGFLTEWGDLVDDYTSSGSAFAKKGFSFYWTTFFTPKTNDEYKYYAYAVAAYGAGAVVPQTVELYSSPGGSSTQDVGVGTVCAYP